MKVLYNTETEEIIYQSADKTKFINAIWDTHIKPKIEEQVKLRLANQKQLGLDECLKEKEKKD